MDAPSAALFLHCRPGTVRELKDAIDHAAAAAPSTGVEVDLWHPPPATAGGPAPRPGGAGAARAFRPIDDELRELERRRMTEALAATGGVQNRAADLIRMPLRTFVTKLKRYAITPAEWKGGA
jgi:two-component system response regulator AtoC